MARAMFERQPIGDDVEPRCQPSDGSPRQDMMSLNHAGNGAPEHTTETGYAPKPLANGAHGALELCVRVFWPRKSAWQRHSERLQATQQNAGNTGEDGIAVVNLG